MANGGLNHINSQAELDDLLMQLKELSKLQADAANELLGLQISNTQRLLDAQKNAIKKRQEFEEKVNQQTNTHLIAMGFQFDDIRAARDLKLRADAAKKAFELAKKNNDEAEQERLKKVLANIDAEYDARSDAQKELDKEIQKQDKKNHAEALKRATEVARSAMGDGFLGAFTNRKHAADEARKELEEQGFTGEELEAEVKKAVNNATKAAAFGALADFAKELKGTMQEIGDAKSQIDTRLQGSSNNKGFFGGGGSAWDYFERRLTQNVGMSPFIKQADAANNLKTLVGQGISFNVEQRAFLQTISDKIATTFEATDGTLLKLVRIQQADTTAARLGMESALTAFLNSMYETTEYMQSAAADIRQNIYEASALMDATSATAFEYQVQKWMGSLYSVGFSNTSGLSAALGKLAAGDISGITDGSYGNLLVMAANKANLSIAEILADGLDDSETNRLMQAMVEYLQQIYAETKDSKVVQQQFANVYGLTASDLKAAANLYGSTNSIAKNGMGYNDMLSRLYSMYGSIGNRMSIGGMMNNITDNFKYTVANSMATNPVFYALYTVADMLDSAAGGLPINVPQYLGTGFGSSIKVSDIMKVATVSGGIMQGVGTMVAGLFNGSGGMFNALGSYGISKNGLTTLTRGEGTGIQAISGMSTSESGYAGNSNAGDAQGKILSDNEADQQEQVAKAADESKETKLSTIDEHVVQIHDLLESVISLNEGLKVIPAGSTSWTDVISGIVGGR